MKPLGAVLLFHRETLCSLPSIGAASVVFESGLPQDNQQMTTVLQTLLRMCRVTFLATSLKWRVRHTKISWFVPAMKAVMSYIPFTSMAKARKERSKHGGSGS